ncbi:MAG: malate synthase G [Acidobacteriota bacterium]|jgi:malate synthase|nr:malate synthase G [Acidobacteriota bacterium]
MTDPNDRITVGNLRIDRTLYEFVRDEMAQGTGLQADDVWASFDEIVADLAPKNRALLDQRDCLQEKLDSWHRARVDGPFDEEEYRAFLLSIGYLVSEGDDFQIATDSVDREISLVAGPQLVVPVDNPRYALNATNARWGSLYDALYGTDVIPEEEGSEIGTSYNQVRGEYVVAKTEKFLDATVPLSERSYSEVIAFKLNKLHGICNLTCVFGDGVETGLADESQFVGHDVAGERLSVILLRHNELHIEIQIDPSHIVGAAHPAGVKDVLLESAITTIQDFEDSISAVDAADKVVAYRNWLGIMNGTLEATFVKNGSQMTRKLSADRTYCDRQGDELKLSGRSLLLVRNVGIHMYTDAVVTAEAEDIPEGFLDAMLTVFAAMHDLKRLSSVSNSRFGNVYIVKPKLHGPDEVAATVELFERIELALGLPARTIKIGIMDEERRTTVNLKECIRAARDRAIFINTGFLDRTGDEIHTSMEAGPMIPKPEIKLSPWILAYEDWNVDIGIECGLPGRAQIGKGMWAAPDEMAEMVETKVHHPRAGANTAWVPSPTAATLHAMHYHEVEVSEVQEQLIGRERADLNDILTLPLLRDREMKKDEIQAELDNNAQGILGYVVRWVGQGVGCSKVPDINDIGLMEDRATLRISSQHIANWVHHGIVTEDQVIATFQKMAAIVDEQNAGDPNYTSMAANFDHSIEFQASLDLVFDGREESNGYTEHVLHSRRREMKARS